MVSVVGNMSGLDGSYIKKAFLTVSGEVLLELASGPSEDTEAVVMFAAIYSNIRSEYSVIPVSDLTPYELYTLDVIDYQELRAHAVKLAEQEKWDELRTLSAKLLSDDVPAETCECGASGAMPGTTVSHTEECPL
jgi:hypothetical protein